MILSDVNKIYKKEIQTRKYNKSEIKMKKAIEYVFNVISDNPGLNVRELITTSGKCSEIINRCVKNLVESKRVVKKRYACIGVLIS